MKTRVSHYRIRIPERYERPQKPFRAVFLSDQHDRDVLTDDRFMETLCKADPEAVFCGGDMLTAGRRIRGREENALRLYEALSARFKVYAVNGNHESRLKEYPSYFNVDYEDYIHKLERMGVTTVGGRREEVFFGGARMEIAGFELPLSSYDRRYHVMPGSDALTDDLGDKDPDVFTILLAHHPDAFAAYRDWGADLVLSGHLHGGLIVLPGIGGVAGGSLKPFPKYCRGSFEEGASRMIVSAGIGEHTRFLRFNNPYEIVILEFM